MRSLVVALAALLAITDGAAGTVEVPLGTPVGLVLVQHVSAAIDAPDTVLYARVSNDVVRGGARVITAGTLVRGSLLEGRKASAAWSPGALLVAFDAVEAVDGSRIPLDARFSVQGLDRSVASGLVTSLVLLPLVPGDSPIVLAGSRFNAQVSATTSVHTDRVAAAPSPVVTDPDLARPRLSTADLGRFKVGSGRTFSGRTIDVGVDAASASDDAVLGIVAINGERLPQPVKPTESLAEVKRFDAWAVLRYCRKGLNSIELAWLASDRESPPSLAELQVDLPVAD